MATINAVLSNLPIVNTLPRREEVLRQPENSHMLCVVSGRHNSSRKGVALHTEGFFRTAITRAKSILLAIDPSMLSAAAYAFHVH